MRLDIIQRARTSYLEYMQIVEGKNRDREYMNAQTRLICYFNTSGKAKSGRKLELQDLWKIGDEVVVERIDYDEDLRDYGKKKGILIV